MLWVVFFQTNIDFLTSHFDGFFLYHSKSIVILSLKLKSYCSDFRYESNGIFVLGVGFFFLQTNFDFLTSHF